MKFSLKFLILPILISHNLFASLESRYQADADLYRFKHLKYYGELIEEFHEVTGRYPLQGKSEFQNYVYIATSGQKKYIEKKTGTPKIWPKSESMSVFLNSIDTDMEVFRSELEEGLGRKIDLKFDPQKVPTIAYNFYTYMVEGEDYHFIVFPVFSYPFAKNMGKHGNILGISSIESENLDAWNFHNLLRDESFSETLSREPEKPIYFEKLEKKYR